MSFTIRMRGGGNGWIVAEYLCPVCGRQAATVQRDAGGDPPATIWCPQADTCGAGLIPFVISKSGTARPRSFEVTTGKYEKPERKTWLDTRNLGEGQALEEFQADRRKIWDERRRQDLKALIDEGPNPAW